MPSIADMTTTEWGSLLARLVSGHIMLPDFSKEVDDRLFDLRHNPDMTPLKRDLSMIQLYLHEIEEGWRDMGAVYQLAWRLLDA